MGEQIYLFTRQNMTLNKRAQKTTLTPSGRTKLKGSICMTRGMKFVEADFQPDAFKRFLDNGALLEKGAKKAEKAAPKKAPAKKKAAPKKKAAAKKKA